MNRILGILLAACLGPVSAFAQSPVVVEYYHLDALGSVRAVTNASGAEVRRHDYAPFGEDLATVIANDPIRFVGKERDVESALDYSMARFYAAKWGRFTTVDPGHVGGNIFDPQSWNAYGYARNNPLRFIDSTGTDYFVNIDGGRSFWASDSEFEDLRGNPGAGISLLGGLVLAGGRIVGTYQYYAPFDRILVDAGRRAEPGVNLAAGALAAFGAVAAPIPMAIAGCVASGSDCSAVGTAMAAIPLAGRLRFTATTASRMAQAGRHVPVHILAEAIKHGTRMPDPQNAPGAIKIVQEIFVNGARRTLTIIYREADNTILHFHYQ